MRHVIQPKKSNYCGQCAMAMVTNSSMEQMIEEVGETDRGNGGSTINLYYKYFLANNIAYSADTWFDNRKSMDLSGKGIISVCSGNRKWGHAMAFEDGKVYDPGGMIFEDVNKMRNYYRNLVRGFRVYSIIRIEEEI